jgi:flagellar motor protein MotB
MKIAIYVLIALLAVSIGASTAFYQNAFRPMAAEFEKMKAGMRELDKAKAELTKYKDKEKRETAWLKPAADSMSSGLSDAIKAGNAEVITTDNSVIVNIAEDTLYMPGSYTFSNSAESQKLLLNIESLLKGNELKGKEIIIGNTTDAVPAHGKGRKKIPAKDARKLAADRSAALVKHLEKKGVDQNALIAAAYSSKQPEIGSRIKARKVVILLENPPVVQAAISKQEPAGLMQSAPAPAPRATPNTIPIQPAKPKTN